MIFFLLHLTPPLKGRKPLKHLKYHFHGNAMSDFKMVFTGLIFEGFRLSNDIEIMMITKICDREKKDNEKKDCQVANRWAGDTYGVK